MLRKRLTDNGIERLASPSNGRLEIWDSLSPGLALRVGPRRKSFTAMVRVEGRLKRVTLGVFPAMRIAQARTAAREAAALAQSGVDPREHRDRQKAERARARVNTVSAVVEEYIERYAKARQRAWADTAARLRCNLVRAHGEKPVGELTRADVVRIVDDASARGLSAGANRILANTKTFLRWCVERGLIERSPAEHVRPPAREIARDRVLDDQEIALIWRATEAIGYPYGDIVRLLLLTGQRRDEVARMMWSELDLSSATWVIPAAKNKSSRPHAVPLAQLACAIINPVTPVGPLLFPAQNNLQGEAAFSGWSRAKQRLDERSSVRDWRLHDLRRTAASGMARLGADPHIVERVLNHATTAAGPLARVYQRYAYEAEKREALVSWDAHMQRLIEDAHE